LFRRVNENKRKTGSFPATLFFFCVSD